MTAVSDAKGDKLRRLSGINHALTYTTSLRRLSEINRALTYTTSLEAVARLTVDGAAELLAGTAAVLMLQDVDGLLQVRAVAGIPEEKVARFRAPLNDELIERLQGLLDVTDECFLAVPLVVGGTVTGLIAVGLTEPETEPEEWLLSALADQVALGLENARLGGEVRLELEGRLRAAESQTTAKDRALATLAHDIRSPLGAITGYCAILKDGLYGPVTESQVEAIGRIRLGAQHLMSLLDNVMDLARMSGGNVAVSCQPVHFLDVAREAASMLSHAAAAKQQRLTVNGADLVIDADAPRLRQVLVNLIGNAVKFTPSEGMITVTVSESSGETAIRAIAQVTDTGPGVPQAEHARIFEAYYRSEGTAQLPGIGLGLAISAGLVARMGGELTVESGVGAGATFAVSFPCEPGHETICASDENDAAARNLRRNSDEPSRRSQ
jgi:signal transduction histidine kinase